ncbi:hypothetical protein EB796_008511 [Bugula neritina]|uniref:Uncharacterized protein n=1 Tax=Bugula neritina TaxID=10212 RepID=A0A7J7K3H5_BUGNE|nr:hypothetical protein EB796_008511 [Bugula neritina]
MLETINWEAFRCNDVNVFYDKFLQKLTELTNSCKIEHRAKLAKNKSISKPWINGDLLFMMKKKNRFYRNWRKSLLSTKLEVKYKRLRNELNMQLRSAKYNYFLEAVLIQNRFGA